MTIPRLRMNHEAAFRMGPVGMAMSFHGQGDAGNCRVMATEHPGGAAGKRSGQPRGSGLIDQQQRRRPIDPAGRNRRVGADEACHHR